MQNSHIGWSVEITENGRSGSVIYREAGNSLTFHWEFGGQDTLVAITGGDIASWKIQHAWAVGRRAEILQRVADEVIRQTAPGATAEIDLATGWISIRSGSPAIRPPTPQSGVRQFDRDKWNKYRMRVAGIVFALAMIAVAVSFVLTGPQPNGIPIASSHRAGDQIATLIQTQERYIPSLHRNPEKDRYRLDLFVYPVDGGAKGKMFPIGRSYRISELQLARIIGYDGNTVWYSVDKVEGVNVKTRKKSTPGQADSVSRGSALGPKLEDFLCPGVRPSPTQWLGLHSIQEAETEYKPNSWLRPLNHATNAKVERRLYRGDLGPEIQNGIRSMLSLNPLTDETFLNAAFLRSGPNLDPIRLSGPEGFLFIYTSKPSLHGTLMAARVDTEGNILWKTDTALDRFRLRQILPDDHHLVFIGPELPIPDQVSPILLTILDTSTGSLSSTSLNR